jgi:hypothetical protein
MACTAGFAGSGDLSLVVMRAPPEFFIQTHDF